jgi:hypothetical protein
MLEREKELLEAAWGKSGARVQVVCAPGRMVEVREGVLLVAAVEMMETRAAKESGVVEEGPKDSRGAGGTTEGQSCGQRQVAGHEAVEGLRGEGLTSSQEQELRNQQHGGERTRQKGSVLLHGVADLFPDDPWSMASQDDDQDLEQLLQQQQRAAVNQSAVQHSMGVNRSSNASTNSNNVVGKSYTPAFMYSPHIVIATATHDRAAAVAAKAAAALSPLGLTIALLRPDKAVGDGTAASAATGGGVGGASVLVATAADLWAAAAGAAMKMEMLAVETFNSDVDDDANGVEANLAQQQLQQQQQEVVVVVDMSAVDWVLLEDVLQDKAVVPEPFMGWLAGLLEAQQQLRVVYSTQVGSQHGI